MKHFFFFNSSRALVLTRYYISKRSEVPLSLSLFQTTLLPTQSVSLIDITVTLALLEHGDRCPKRHPTPQQSAYYNKEKYTTEGVGCRFGLAHSVSISPSLFHGSKQVGVCDVSCLLFPDLMLLPLPLKPYDVS